MNTSTNVSANSIHFFWGWNLENLLWRHRRATGLQGNRNLDLFWGRSRSSNFNLSCKKPLKTVHQAKGPEILSSILYFLPLHRLETMQVTTFILLIKPETEKPRAWKGGRGKGGELLLISSHQIYEKTFPKVLASIKNYSCGAWHCVGSVLSSPL